MEGINKKGAQWIKCSFCRMNFETKFGKRNCEDCEIERWTPIDHICHNECRTCRFPDNKNQWYCQTCNKDVCDEWADACTPSPFKCPLCEEYVDACYECVARTQLYKVDFVCVPCWVANFT